MKNEKESEENCWHPFLCYLVFCYPQLNENGNGKRSLRVTCNLSSLCSGAPEMSTPISSHALLDTVEQKRKALCLETKNT